MPKLVVGFRNVCERGLSVEVADGLGAAVHLGVFEGPDEDVGGSGGVAGAVGDYPALGLVVVLEEEGRDRPKDQVPGVQGAEVRVERTEGKAHHDLARRLGVDFGEYLRRAKGRNPAWEIEADEFGFPATGMHEITERLEPALSARHRRDDGEERHRV